METPAVTAGILFMPFFGADLIASRRRREARRVLADEALGIAADAGARIVCLGGLTGALSGYGRRVVEPARDLGVTVTTGHAVTAVTVVRTAQRAIRESGSTLLGSHVTVLGVGSVGAAVARLLAVEEDPPDELVLVDRPAATARVEKIAQDLRIRSDIDVWTEYTDDFGVLAQSSACYSCDLLISAVSLPNVIDIGQVASGTMLVDDSQPYCWSREDAWHRSCVERDILPCEAGLVDCRELGYRSHFPFDFADHGPEGSTVSWCCLAEGLLLALDPDLHPTTGEPGLDQVLAYLDAFDRHNFKVAPLQCGPHLLPVEKFGGKVATSSC